MGILRGGRRCTGELGGVYWGLGGKQAHQPDCRVWHFSPRSRVRKARAIDFRCAKSFSGAEKYLQARLRCALGAAIEVRAARRSA